MPARAVYFVLALAVLFTLLVSFAAVSSVRLRRRSREPWDVLLRRLLPLDCESIALIAADLHAEAAVGMQDGAFVFDPSQIWDLIGGMDGLTRMEANCAVLIELAFVLQDRYPEALVVAEELRRNAREIQWHLERLRGAARLGKLGSVFEEYAQGAIASYHQMTERVLMLYEWADASAHAELARVL